MIEQIPLEFKKMFKGFIDYLRLRHQLRENFLLQDTGKDMTYPMYSWCYYIGLGEDWD